MLAARHDDDDDDGISAIVSYLIPNTVDRYIKKYMIYKHIL